MTLIKRSILPEIEKTNCLGVYFAATMVGEHGESKQLNAYLSLLGRLIDKACDEYATLREYMELEVRERNMSFDEINKRGTGQHMYFSALSNHLENCVSAMSRVYKVIDQLSKNRSRKLKFNDLGRLTLRHIRNHIEHMDERIRDDSYIGIMFMFSEDGGEAKLMNTTLSVVDLAHEIKFWGNLYSQKHHLLIQLYYKQKEQEAEIDQMVKDLFS